MLGLSQSELLRQLGLKLLWITVASRNSSEGQQSSPCPSFFNTRALLEVHMEDFADDELDLPAKLPGKVKYKGIKSSFRKR